MAENNETILSRDKLQIELAKIELDQSIHKISNLNSIAGLIVPDTAVISCVYNIGQTVKNCFSYIKKINYNFYPIKNTLIVGNFVISIGSSIFPKMDIYLYDLTEAEADIKYIEIKENIQNDSKKSIKELWTSKFRLILCNRKMYKIHNNIYKSKYHILHSQKVSAFQIGIDDKNNILATSECQFALKYRLNIFDPRRCEENNEYENELSLIKTDYNIGLLFIDSDLNGPFDFPKFCRLNIAYENSSIIKSVHDLSLCICKHKQLPINFRNINYIKESLLRQNSKTLYTYDKNFILHIIKKNIINNNYNTIYEYFDLDTTLAIVKARLLNESIDDIIINSNIIKSYIENYKKPQWIIPTKVIGINPEIWYGKHYQPLKRLYYAQNTTLLFLGRLDKNSVLSWLPKDILKLILKTLKTIILS
jgi:hypothetical protein